MEQGLYKRLQLCGHRQSIGEMSLTDVRKVFDEVFDISSREKQRNVILHTGSAGAEIIRDITLRQPYYPYYAPGTTELLPMEEVRLRYGDMYTELPEDLLSQLPDNNVHPIRTQDKEVNILKDTDVSKVIEDFLS